MRRFNTINSSETAITENLESEIAIIGGVGAGLAAVATASQEGLPINIPAIADHGKVAHPCPIPKELPLLAA